jgi:hypothetical protein
MLIFQISFYFMLMFMIMIIVNYFMDSLVRSSIMEYCRLGIYGFNNNLHKVINYFLLAVLQICQILILVFSFLGLLI